jgi:hypothetical protein
MIVRNHVFLVSDLQLMWERLECYTALRYTADVESPEFLFQINDFYITVSVSVPMNTEWFQKVIELQPYRR